jgi:hypothetical protein
MRKWSHWEYGRWMSLPVRPYRPTHGRAATLGTDDDFEVCKDKTRHQETHLDLTAHPWFFAVVRDSSRLDRAYHVLSANHHSVLPPRSVHQQSVSIQANFRQERRYLHKGYPRRQHFSPHCLFPWWSQTSSRTPSSIPSQHSAEVRSHTITPLSGISPDDQPL